MELTLKVEQAIYKSASKTKEPKNYVKIALHLVALYNKHDYTEKDLIKKFSF